MVKNLYIDERFKMPPAECRPLQIVHCFEDFGTTNEQIEDGLKEVARTRDWWHSVQCWLEY
jgi:hypothetical protein